MIKLTPYEAEYIKKNVKRNRLKVASANKRKCGKTYYVLCDDYSTLNAVAKMRGISKRELLNN